MKYKITENRSERVKKTDKDKCRLSRVWTEIGTEKGKGQERGKEEGVIHGKGLKIGGIGTEREKAIEARGGCWSTEA